MTDLDIARSVQPKKSTEIAKALNIDPNSLEPYGHFKAKLPLSLIQENAKGKLILVTAITPTPAGEGKTTVSVGLTDGLNKIGKRAIAALREPSLGPVFGLKGGATGGGKSQVIPMEDINLHFTGDFSAIEKANNLLCALIDNHLFHNLEPVINPKTIAFKRVMDMNDRALRNIITGLQGNGTSLETGFNITAASEIMAILCLSKNVMHLKEKLAQIFIGETFKGEPVYAKDINAVGAMASLLKDAIKPNLVQTLEHNPVILHGGPFANIAQGTNSILATQMALSISEFTVTEAGFAADLGAEKFFHIKCREAGISPSAVVIVATIKALKYHGNKPLANLSEPDVEALKLGTANLKKHIENIRKFSVEPIVALNHFYTDTQEEINFLAHWCEQEQVTFSLTKGWSQGGEGCQDLAEKVVQAAHNQKEFTPLFKKNAHITQKIEIIAKEIYGASGVAYSTKAKNQLKKLDKFGLSNLDVCMAKTQKSISDKEELKGAPSGFMLNVREFEIASGAGFIIPICGNIMRMPGLSKEPAAFHIALDENHEIQGLF
ncbi:MAG: formate--tetrahydrofolate ligase [Luteibaculaceae bacterium]